MRFALVAAFLAAGSCAAQAQSLSCSSGQSQVAVAELLFGRKTGDRIAVTQSKWTRFLDREISPRFPDGLTVVDAQGQWRDPVRGRLVREPSKVVTIVLKDAAAAQERLAAIIDAYKLAFRQQSVGLIVRPACAAF